MPAQTFEQILKYNPYHDDLGRFSSSNGGGGAAAGGGESDFLDENGEFDPFAAIMWAAENPDEWSQKPQENWEKPYQMVDGKDMTKGSEEERQKVANMTIEEIMKAQGFDGRPKVAATIDEFSEAVKENGNIACRGIGAKSASIADAYVDQLQNGEFYVECSGGSLFGRGMYAAISWDGVTDYDSAADEADGYARGHGRIINMTIDKSAKVVDFYDLLEESRADYRTFQPSNNSRVNTAGKDIGAYAAAKGYDAIKVPGKNIAVVLNRTKLTILEETGFIDQMEGGEDLLYGDWDMPEFLRGE